MVFSGCGLSSVFNKPMNDWRAHLVSAIDNDETCTLVAVKKLCDMRRCQAAQELRTASVDISSGAAQIIPALGGLSCGPECPRRRAPSAKYKI